MDDLVAKHPISKRVELARHAATVEPFPTIVDFVVDGLNEFGLRGSIH